MKSFLGQTETEIGTIFFEMNGENFEIRTHKMMYTVYDSDIKEVEGKYFYQIPPGFSGSLREIEIPTYILDRRGDTLKEIEISKPSIGHTETPQGKVYFSITGDGKIRAWFDGNEEITEKIYTVEGKRVLFLPDIGLENEFVEIPAEVEKALQKFKLDQEWRDLRLVYAGRSLLTGKHFYKFNTEVTNATFNRVKSIFEYIEEEGQDIKSVSGWVTTNPKLAEQYLRLRKNTVEDRKEEIEKQKAAAIKENEKIIKKLQVS